METRKDGTPKARTKDGKVDRRGGRRENSGRKPRSVEDKLIEKLDNLIEADEVIMKMKEMAISGDFRAIQLYMAYRYGRPVEKQIQVQQQVPVIDMNTWK